MKRNDRGYSLVEIIIVIAIIAIMTAGASVVFINWQSRNINDCVQKIDTALSAAKIDGTSKESTELSIRKESDGIYYLYLTGADKKALGDKQIQITYKTLVSSSEQITESQPLTISYDRVTGGFQPIKDSDGNDTYCTDIIVTRGSKTVTIKLARSTGKHSIER